jgi:hypothetical protein
MSEINCIHITKETCLTPERAEKYLTSLNKMDEEESPFTGPNHTIRRYVSNCDVITISFGAVQSYTLEMLYEDERNPINDKLLGRKRRKPRSFFTNEEHDDSILEGMDD